MYWLVGERWLICRVAQSYCIGPLKLWCQVLTAFQSSDFLVSWNERGIFCWVNTACIQAACLLIRPDKTSLYVYWATVCHCVCVVWMGSPVMSVVSTWLFGLNYILSCTLSLRLHLSVCTIFIIILYLYCTCILWCKMYIISAHAPWQASTQWHYCLVYVSS